MSELERRKSLALLAGSPARPGRANSYLRREGQSRELLSQRSWQIRWNRNGIAIGYSRYMTGDVRPSARRHFITSGIVLLAAAVVGIGAIGAMASKDSGDDGHYLLSIDVPASTSARRPLPPSRTPGDADKVKTMRPVATLVRPEPEQVRPAGGAPPDDLQTEPDDAAIQPGDPDALFTAEAPAVAAALSSGQFQTWQDPAHARRGFVVVGASEKNGDRTCRDLTILVRQDGEANTITRQRRCRDGVKDAWREG